MPHLGLRVGGRPLKCGSRHPVRLDESPSPRPFRRPDPFDPFPGTLCRLSYPCRPSCPSQSPCPADTRPLCPTDHRTDPIRLLDDPNGRSPSSGGPGRRRDGRCSAASRRERRQRVVLSRRVVVRPKARKTGSGGRSSLTKEVEPSSTSPAPTELERPPPPTSRPPSSLPHGPTSTSWTADDPVGRRQDGHRLLLPLLPALGALLLEVRGQDIDARPRCVLLATRTTGGS